MASISGLTSTPSREGSPKRLAEFLQEEQEPFILEVYLLEHGCTRKSFNSEGSFGCFSSNCSSKKENKFSTRSFSLGGRVDDVARKWSEIAKAICNKLVSISEIIGLKVCDIGDREIDDTTQGRRNQKEAVTMEESERLSSASLSTEFNSLSETDIEDTSMDDTQNQRQLSHQANESATERTIEWRRVEENKQCSPDSVLDEIGASPIYHVGTNRQEEHPSTSRFSLLKKPTEDSIFSASLWDLLIRNRKKKKSVYGPSNETCSRYISSKKALQERTQLLFDCVREAVESQGRKQRKTEHLMGPEELGRIICDNIRVWERQSANKKKITRLLRSDILGSFEEWDSFEGFIGEIVKEVGDLILEEIKDKMVEELIDLCICKTQ